MYGKQFGQDRTSWRVYLVCISVPMSAVLFSTVYWGIPPRAILGDAASYVQQPFYLGLMSNFGVLCWWTAAIACLIATSVLPSGIERRATMMAGALSALLGLDDVMLLHDKVLLEIGIGQSKVLAIYGLLTVYYLCAFHRFHKRMGCGLLVMAILFLGLSVAIDLTVDIVLPRLPNGWLQSKGDLWFGIDLATSASQRRPSIETVFTYVDPKLEGMAFADYRRVAEDGSKFVGLFAWAAYHTRVVRRVLLMKMAENGLETR